MVPENPLVFSTSPPVLPAMGVMPDIMDASLPEVRHYGSLPLRNRFLRRPGKYYGCIKRRPG